MLFLIVGIMARISINITKNKTIYSLVEYKYIGMHNNARNRIYLSDLTILLCQYFNAK